MGLLQQKSWSLALRRSRDAVRCHASVTGTKGTEGVIGQGVWGIQAAGTRQWNARALGRSTPLWSWVPFHGTT